MSPKVKMYVYYSLSFLILYLISFALLRLLAEPSAATRFAPIIVAFIFSFKPYMEEAQSGRRYGLKHLFFKKIWYFN